MKAWELEIIANKAKGNSYVVLSAGDSFLCEKLNGEYFVKNDDKTKITKIDSVIKL